VEGWVAGLALGGRRNLTPIFSRRLLTGVLESRRQDGGATKERLSSIPDLRIAGGAERLFCSAGFQPAGLTFALRMAVLRKKGLIQRQLPRASRPVSCPRPARRPARPRRCYSKVKVASGIIVVWEFK
jgi:hypothetical protein